MGFSSFNQQNNHGITDEEEEEVLNSISSSSSVVLSHSDSMEEEEVTSSASSSSSSASFTPTPPTSGSTSPSDNHQLATDPLDDMSSLLQQLPFKRGLSKHFNGKSQSFTSLSNVMCLEDLAKPENPYNKRLKSCKSYGGLLESHKSNLPHRSSFSSRLISKKASRGSCSSLSGKRNSTSSSFLGNRPPIPPPPHRSTSTSSFSNQNPLFV